MKHSKSIPMLNLQIFADGGADGAAGAAADSGTAQGQGVTGAAALPQTKGVKSNPLANVKYGKQPEQAAPAAEVQTETAQPIDRNAEFEKLIKGAYKDLYDARIQDTIRQRLKGTKETVDKYAATVPVLEMLARKYGIEDPGNIEALSKAINDDNAFWEDLAFKSNMTVDEYKKFAKIESENAMLRKQAQERENREKADRLYQSWVQQEQEAKKVYPAFDLRTELNNPKFVDLLRSNIDAKTAYEVIHKDEIIPAAMQFAARTVEQNVAKSIAAKGARPTENGMVSQASAVVKSDVSQLSRADRQEIIRRVQRGEKVVF